MSILLHIKLYTGTILEMNVPLHYTAMQIKDALAVQCAFEKDWFACIAMGKVIQDNDTMQKHFGTATTGKVFIIFKSFR